MRALLLEGKFALCQELIELRKSEKVKVFSTRLPQLD